MTREPFCFAWKERKKKKRERERVRENEREWELGILSGWGERKNKIVRIKKDWQRKRKYKKPQKRKERTQKEN